MISNYDFIILGGGASGLLLAYKMSNESFFSGKSILIIDEEKKSKNDRTWCFWEKEAGLYDDILTKKWGNIIFKSDDVNLNKDISPYHYKMLRSKNFYQKMWETLELKPNITFYKDKVLEINQKNDVAEVKTKKEIFTSKVVCNSILFGTSHLNQSKYPVLQQHFIGYFVKTESPVFDDDAATFMDFTVPQKGNTRFMYVLPYKKNEALFEYTLFSKKLLKEQKYKDAIVNYLLEKGIKNYEIIETEQGSIPMTSYEFWKKNSKNVVNMGTAGGWSKASTGFTFKNINKNTSKLIEHLKTKKPLNEFKIKNRFWFYDMLLLDILASKNHLGASIFSRMFRKISVQKIFKFLDEETSFIEELSIFTKMKIPLFTKALLKRLF